MLQRVQTKISQSRSVGMTVNSKDAALFAEFSNLDLSHAAIITKISDR